jgi:hypothetical protein
MGMITETIGGETCRFFLEEGSGDGGRVLETQVDTTDGMKVYREWWSDPAIATRVFEQLTSGEKLARVSRAKEAVAR